MAPNQQKLETINNGGMMVDKLPSGRLNGFFKKRGMSERENVSMITDRARKSDDEISYTLDEKSTIEEEGVIEGQKKNILPTYLEDENVLSISDGSSTVDRKYLEDTELMSVSATSSANFSYITQDTNMNEDAYPALYNPAGQAEYENSKKLSSRILEALNGAASTVRTFLESLCGSNQKE